MLHARRSDSHFSRILNTAQVASICIGGFVFLLIILVTGTWLGCRGRQKRVLTQLDQEAASRKAHHSEQSGRIITSPRVGRKNLNHGEVEWGKLPSSESLYQARWKTRDSTAPLRVPNNTTAQPSDERIPGRRLPRRKSRKRRFPFASTKQKHLSIIMESPRNQDPSSAPGSQTVYEEVPMQVVESVSPNFPQNQLTSRATSMSPPTPPSSPAPEIVPHPALRPGSLFAENQGRGCWTQTSIHAGRSQSVFSVLVPKRMDSMVHGQEMVGRVHGHSRSLSLGSHASGLAPDHPPPPLPSARIGSIARASVVRRAPSRETLSSLESGNSSILNRTQLTPDTGSQFFSDESTTTAQIGLLEAETTTFRDTTKPQARAARDSALDKEINKAADMSTKHAISSTGAGSKSSNSRVEPQSNALNNASISPGARHENVRRQSIKGPLRANTPKRYSSSSQMVSASGSPLERRRSTALRETASDTRPSMFQQLSETSTQFSSAWSSVHNLFPWDPTYAVRPSALKGSPKAKGHRRSQTSAHVSFLPSFLGPPNREASSSNVYDTVEEAEEGQAEKGRWPGSNVDALSKPSSSSSFEPDVVLGSCPLRLSATPGSPTLSFAKLSSEQQEEEEELHLSKNKRVSVGPRSRPGSTTSSTLTATDFPRPPIFNAGVLSMREEYSKNPDTEKHTETSRREKVPLTFRTLREVQSRPRTTSNHGQELAFPMIDIQPTFRPASESQVETTDSSNESSPGISSGSLVAAKQARNRRQRFPSPTASRGISPLKAYPTTSLSRTSASSPPLPVIQTPMSSKIEPLDNGLVSQQPYTQSLSRSPTKLRRKSTARPKGPRASPTRGLGEIAQQLRRQNSEARIARTGGCRGRVARDSTIDLGNVMTNFIHGFDYWSDSDLHPKFFPEPERLGKEVPRNGDDMRVGKENHSHCNSQWQCEQDHANCPLNGTSVDKGKAFLDDSKNDLISPSVDRCSIKALNTICVGHEEKDLCDACMVSAMSHSVYDADGFLLHGY